MTYPLQVLGYGLTGDAHHLTTPSGDGAKRCILGALKDAGIAAEDVGHVNAHATSTPVGDTLESQAIEQVLGNKVLVTSTKGGYFHFIYYTSAATAVHIYLCCCSSTCLPLLTQLYIFTSTAAAVHIYLYCCSCTYLPLLLQQYMFTSTDTAVHIYLYCCSCTYLPLLLQLYIFTSAAAAVHVYLY